MRYVTFLYNVIGNCGHDFKVHKDKETALKYFNANYKRFFAVNTKFKAAKLPASYGYPMRKFYGMSARGFKKMFDMSIDDVLADMESEEK